MDEAHCSLNQSSDGGASPEQGALSNQAGPKRIPLSFGGRNVLVSG